MMVEVLIWIGVFLVIFGIAWFLMNTFVRWAKFVSGEVALRRLYRGFANRPTAVEKEMLTNIGKGYVDHFWKDPAVVERNQWADRAKFEIRQRGMRAEEKQREEKNDESRGEGEGKVETDDGSAVQKPEENPGKKA